MLQSIYEARKPNFIHLPEDSLTKEYNKKLTCHLNILYYPEIKFSSISLSPKNPIYLLHSRVIISAHSLDSIILGLTICIKHLAKAMSGTHRVFRSNWHLFLFIFSGFVFFLNYFQAYIYLCFRFYSCFRGKFATMIIWVFRAGIGTVGITLNLSIRETWECDRMTVSESTAMPSKKTRDFLPRHGKRLYGHLLSQQEDCVVVHNRLKVQLEFS